MKTLGGQMKTRASVTPIISVVTAEIKPGKARMLGRGDCVMLVDRPVWVSSCVPMANGNYKLEAYLQDPYEIMFPHTVQHAPEKTKPTLSAKGRASIAAAQRKRWAEAKRKQRAKKDKA